MPTYAWSGIDGAGKKISGIDCANNKRELKSKFIKQDIFLLKTSTVFWRSSKIKFKHIAVFIEQLAVLINANINLVAAFDILIQDEDNKILKNLIIDCKNSISAGQSLYKTLAQYPQYFNELLCGLVKVGEQSGNLDVMLNELSDYFTKITIQKRKIIKALLYPTAILIITFFVTAILLLFVVPQFKTMYGDFGASLPGYTQFIINLGIFFQKYWYAIFGGIIMVVIGAKFIYQRSQKFRNYLDDLSLKIPFLNKILIFAMISRIAKTIGLSFKSGMPLLQAINMAAITIKNWRYRLAIQKITKSIASGNAFHVALEEQKLFPAVVIQLIALGEETGKLDLMLEKIAMIFDENLNAIIENLNTLLEPIIMLILGIIVGGLIIGMYLPIFRLGTVL
jgi:type IV pilus assembly protein PilC